MYSEINMVYPQPRSLFSTIESLPPARDQKQKRKCPSYQRRAKARIGAFLKAKKESANTHKAYEPQKPGYVAEGAENGMAIHKALWYDPMPKEVLQGSLQQPTRPTAKAASPPTIPAASPSTNIGSQHLPATQVARHSSTAAPGGSMGSAPSANRPSSREDPPRGSLEARPSPYQRQATTY